ncbi:MAG: hypothetical protein U0V54_13940 [Saprospiraceae bacterium]
MLTFFCQRESNIVARIDVYHKMTTSIQMSLHGTSLSYPEGIRSHYVELGTGKSLFNKILVIALQVQKTMMDDEHCQVILTLIDGMHEESYALITGQMKMDKPWISNLFMLIFKKKRGT